MNPSDYVTFAPPPPNAICPMCGETVCLFEGKFHQGDFDWVTSWGPSQAVRVQTVIPYFSWRTDSCSCSWTGIIHFTMDQTNILSTIGWSRVKYLGDMPSIPRRHLYGQQRS